MCPCCKAQRRQNWWDHQCRAALCGRCTRVEIVAANGEKTISFPQRRRLNHICLEMQSGKAAVEIVSMPPLNSLYNPRMGQGRRDPGRMYVDTCHVANYGS